MSWVEIVLGYVGAAATKSIIIGGIILATASFFVEINVAHPAIMLLFLVLISVSFSLFGFILGVWADGWEKLTIVPILVIMPLTFLGGTFYSINMLPEFWQKLSLFNPIVYLISGFRWAFLVHAEARIRLVDTLDAGRRAVGRAVEGLGDFQHVGPGPVLEGFGRCTGGGHDYGSQRNEYSRGSCSHNITSTHYRPPPCANVACAKVPSPRCHVTSTSLP